MRVVYLVWGDATILCGYADRRLALEHQRQVPTVLIEEVQVLDQLAEIKPAEDSDTAIQLVDGFEPTPLPDIDDFDRASTFDDITPPKKWPS